MLTEKKVTDFYVNTDSLNAFQTISEKKYVQNWPLGVTETADGCVLMRQKGSFKGIGVLDADNIPVGFSKRDYPGDEFIVPDNPDKRDEDVIYGGYLFEHWGHFLVESTCRLWYVLQNVSDTRPVVFAVSRKPSKVFTDFFDFLGLKDRILFVNRPTRFKNVSVPEPSFVFCRQDRMSPLFLMPFDRIVEQVESAGFDKVYLSKSKWTGLDFQCFGEEKLERAFRKNGYHIVYPETMTLKEQVAVLKGASEIATSAGTLAHNILFLPSSDLKERRLIILNRSPTVLPVQACLNEIKKVQCCYIDAFYAPFKNSFIDGPFFWHITDFVKQAFSELKMELSDEDDREVFDDFLKAWGNVYWNKRGAAYGHLIDENKQNPDECERISRLADCFKQKSALQKQFFRAMFHLTRGKLKSHFKFLYKGASFVPTKENTAFIEDLKNGRI